MADDSTATPTDQPSDDAQVTDEAPKPTGEVPPEVKAALRKANKEAETLRLRLKEFEDRDKSEAEKQAERLKALEAEATSARAEALRLRVAAKFGIGDEDADLFLTGSDEETLTKQAERLSARETERKKSGNHVPREGATPSAAGGGDERAFARSLFSGE
jgi:hypothetical protein